MIKKWIVERLGGYYPPTDPHDALTARVADLFSTIQKSDLLRNENGIWYSGSRELSTPEVNQLKAEARMLRNSFLWEQLQNDVEYQAYLKIFLKSRNDFDLIGGKLLKFYIDIINTRLKELCS